MPATDDDTLLPFSLPPVCRKKVSAAFDGGTIGSDGGVFLLAGADKRLGLTDRLAALIPDGRDPTLISHSMADMLRERIFAIACGYPDGNDLDDLRKDPAFKMACGQLPETGLDMASQPTISRLENTPDLRDLIRMSWGMVDLWCKSHARAPKSIVREGLLRPGTGGKPDQTPQKPTGIGPDKLPLAARQSDAPDPAHRCLLADAHAARRHTPDRSLGARRVLHHPQSLVEGRGQGAGDRQPDQAGVRGELSRCSVVPRAGPDVDPAPDVTEGACAPDEPRPINPKRRTDRV